MAFGILEDEYLEHVPGTSLLTDQGVVHGKQVDLDEAKDLKRGRGRSSHIILVPQPSDDPADPLNWPRWKREACFWTLAFIASLDGALSPMVGPGYILLSEQFNVSVDEIASSFGTLLLGLGSFMLLQGSLAVKFGHRIVYLGSVFLMFISCIWCAASPNLASISASRAFQGFGMSAVQCLVGSTIEQIFFVHERGRRTMIWNFSLMSGITIGPLLNSYVIQNLSWQMGFWFISIPLGIGAILIFFFVPETTYIRSPSGSKNTESDKKEGSEDSQISVSSSQNPSFLSQLKIGHGTFSDVPFFKLFFRPFSFLLSPVTTFIFLVYGMQTAWLSLLPICSSTMFTIEYGFNASQIGLTNLGGLVGIILATLITAPLTDWGIVWISKRNRGVYEPEFRIFFVATMLFGTLGYAGWAVGSTRNIPWIGAVACLALANFSMVTSGSAAVTYLLDTHGSNSLQILVVINFFKNMVLYGFTFFVNGMVANRGVKVSLLVLSGCQTFCWLASIPMYIWGKRVRSYLARHPHLFALGEKDV